MIRTLLILILLSGTLASFGQTRVMDRETAARAAAYINHEKEIILYCAECQDFTNRRVSVKDAEVVNNEERYSVRLHGLASDTLVVNELIDLSTVYVRSGREAVSLGHVMHLRCEHCSTHLLWRTMENADSETGSEINEEVEWLIIALSCELPVGTLFSMDTSHISSDRVSLSYDSTRNTLRVVIVSSGNKYAFNLDLHQKYKAVHKKINGTYHLSIRSSAKQDQGIWFTKFDKNARILESGSVHQLSIPMRNGINYKKAVRTFRKISNK